MYPIPVISAEVRDAWASLLARPDQLLRLAKAGRSIRLCRVSSNPKTATFVVSSTVERVETSAQASLETRSGAKSARKRG